METVVVYASPLLSLECTTPYLQCQLLRRTVCRRSMMLLLVLSQLGSLLKHGREVDADNKDRCIRGYALSGLGGHRILRGGVSRGVRKNNHLGARINCLVLRPSKTETALGAQHQIKAAHPLVPNGFALRRSFDGSRGHPSFSAHRPA